MKWLLIIMIRVYQYAISPFMAARCRYYPTCSCYAVEALEKHGWFRGTGLAVWRLLRCNPFAKWSYDPVPEPRPTQSTVKTMKESQ